MFELRARQHERTLARSEVRPRSAYRKTFAAARWTDGAAHRPLHIPREALAASSKALSYRNVRPEQFREFLQFSHG